MKKQFLPLMLMFCFTLVAFQCDDDDITDQETEKTQLNTLKLEIENLANTSTCGDNFECKSIAFGSKPCGGPWSYLIYSTSIDTDKLETLVEDYNNKESLFNQKWGVGSDCSVANPPTSINCENNTCVAVY